MSSRNIRRLVAEKERQERIKKNEEEKNDEVAEEYSPRIFHVKSTFEGLEVSSSSESELSVLSDISKPEAEPQPDLEPYQDEAAGVIPDEDKYGAKRKIYTQEKLDKKEKKKQKKKRKNKKKSDKKPEEMDEVEWSLLKVYQMLGTPPAKVEQIIDEKAVQEKRLFTILPNNINVNYELSKVIGYEDNLKKGRSRPQIRRMRHEIGLSPDVKKYRIRGLSMSRYKIEDNIKFFKFNHTQDYRDRCHDLVEEVKNMLHGQVRHENNLQEVTCVEALLENCDFLYHLEEHKAANQCLEQAIQCMQTIGEHSFNFVDGQTRLLYEYVENRPFHVALLKYLYLMTNTACHRTALELAKVMLNLDPSDPMAVIFIIDTLAIRAREYQWLLDLIEFWREKRQAHRLFHMRYSRALALFRVARKNKDDRLLQLSKNVLSKAIKYFPPVALHIIEFSTFRVPDEIKFHEIFVPPKNEPVSKVLNELMVLYSWLIVPRLRDSHAWNWFMETVTLLIEDYDENPEVQIEVKESARLRASLFRRLPTQMKRHLYAIRSMANYIAEGYMPHTNPSVSFNPYPREGTSTDTYEYFTSWIDQYTPPQNSA